MIRRNLRTLPSLSKNLSMVTLVGGSAQAGEICFGFEQDESGLTLCPSPETDCVSLYSSDNVFAVKSHVCFGKTLLLYRHGLVMSFKKQGEFDVYADFEGAQPFSAETRNEEGDPLLIVAGGESMILLNKTTGERNVYALPTSMYGGIVHCGRLFAVDSATGYKVVWSGLRVTDWSDGIDGSGYIILDSELGKILTLESLGDDILCVRERGFTVIKALADSRNFRISPAQRSVKTAENVNLGGVFGQKYFFASGDGLYSFDGEQIKLEYADKNVDDYNSVYAYGNAYLYVECKYFNKQCIMRYLPSNGKSVFFGLDCTVPLIADGELFCSYAESFHKMTRDNPKEYRLWRSHPVGGCGKKTLKRLYVDSDETPEITVICGDVKRKVKGVGRIPVNLSGESFYVEVGGNIPVRSIVAELEGRK